MKSLTRWMPALLAATLLSLTGSTLVAPSANALTINTSVKTTSKMRGCTASTCVETGSALAGDTVTSFCSRGTSDMIYNFHTGRRVGFVLRSTLNNTSQSTDCASGGFFAQVASSVTMRACANTQCASTGTALPSHSLRSYCTVTGQLSNGSTTWHAVYNHAGSQRVGYVPGGLLSSGSPNVCTPS